jgi:hypothetical protein
VTPTTIKGNKMRKSYDRIHPDTVESVLNNWNQLKFGPEMGTKVIGYTVRDNGIAEWRPVNGETISVLLHHGQITEEHAEATEAAHAAYEAKVIENYKAAMADYEYNDEEMFELRAAFGEGAEVVNVFTGQITRT